MNQDATWYGGRPRPRRHGVRWGPSLPERGTRAPPLFRMSIVVKRSPISATVKHLYKNLLLSLPVKEFLGFMSNYQKIKVKNAS